MRTSILAGGIGVVRSGFVVMLRVQLRIEIVLWRLGYRPNSAWSKKTHPPRIDRRCFCHLEELGDLKVCVYILCVQGRSIVLSNFLGKTYKASQGVTQVTDIIRQIDVGLSRFRKMIETLPATVSRVGIEVQIK